MAKTYRQALDELDKECNADFDNALADETIACVIPALREADRKAYCYGWMKSKAAFMLLEIERLTMIAYPDDGTT